MEREAVPMPLDDAPSPACCDATLALAAMLGGVHRCPGCGAVFEGDRPSHVDLAPRLPPLAEVIADVQLALRWRREHQAVAAPPSRSPLARLQGEAAVRSTSTASAPDLWRLVASPESRVGRRARAGFVAALLDYCAATSRSDDEPDWSRARALAARLAGLDPAHASTLRALARRCDPGVGWSAAAVAVADELAPPALRAAWARPPETGRRGRPRVDPCLPPPDLAAEAWGEDRLVAALAAWARA